MSDVDMSDADIMQRLREFALELCGGDSSRASDLLIQTSVGIAFDKAVALAQAKREVKAGSS